MPPLNGCWGTPFLRSPAPGRTSLSDKLLLRLKPDPYAYRRLQVWLNRSAAEVLHRSVELGLKQLLDDVRGVDWLVLEVSVVVAQFLEVRFERLYLVWGRHALEYSQRLVNDAASHT